MPTWSYGVLTTTKRRNTLLPKTLEALSDGGFTVPRLFVDGAECDQRWSELMLDVTYRYPRVNVAANWILSAWELWVREPQADLYTLFQDDITCVKNLRPYLERTGCPRNAYLNLYSPPSYCELLKRPGWQEGPFLGPPGSDQMGRGALALVFSNQAMSEVLSSLFIVERFRDYAHGWKGIDQAIVVSMNRSSYREWAHLPSLVQHHGQESTLNKLSGTGKEDFPPFIHQERWQSPSYPGDDFDALTLS